MREMDFTQFFEKLPNDMKNEVCKNFIDVKLNPIIPRFVINSAKRIIKTPKINVVQTMFSPRNKYIFTLDDVGNVNVWDTSNCTHLYYLTGHSKQIINIDCSSDEKYIVSCSADHAAILHDASSGTLLHILNGHSDVIASCKFSYDNKYIVTASFDKTIMMWNFDGTLIRTLANHNDCVVCTDISYDNKYIVSGSRDKTTILWDASDGTLIRTFVKHSDTIVCIKFSKSCKYIVTGSADYTAILWNFDGSLIHRLIGHSDIIYTVSFSVDEKYILTWSSDNTAILHSIIDSTLVSRPYKINKNCQLYAEISENNPYILADSRDKICSLYNLYDNTLIYNFAGYNARFTDDDKYIMTLGSKTSNSVVSNIFLGIVMSILMRQNLILYPLRNASTSYYDINLYDIRVFGALKNITYSQFELLNAFAIAIKDRARIHANIEQMNAFNDLPEFIQKPLAIYIKKLD